MKKPHLLARCLEPVAMTESSLRVCIAIASGDQFFADDRARALDAAGGMQALGEPRAPMMVAGGVATIAVEGPLVRKATGLKEVSGLTGYDAIRKDLRAALADPSVKSIAWDFDSPGGEVSGLFELADEVCAARSRKPMVARVARADSAAYVLAAAVGNIEIEQLGEAGSIGVILGVRKPDAEGDDAIYFVSSVSPNKRPGVSTDEGRAGYQAQADYAGDALVAKVAQLRGVAPEKVRSDFGRGGVMHGQQAIDAGLADRLAGSALSTPKGATRMNPTILGLAADADEATINAAAQALVERAAEAEAFRASVLEATGATGNAVALARVVSNTTAAAALEQLQAKMETDAAAARAAAFSEKLAAAIKGGRVTLATAAAEVPLLLGAGKAAARAALAANEGAALGTAAGVVGALASVPVTVDALESLDEWLAAKPAAAMPAARPAATPTARSLQIVRDAGAKATEGVEVDAAGNPIAATKPATVFSIASLTAAATDAAASKENVR